MEQHAYRVRISVLWILAMIAFFAYRTIATEEGATEVSVLSNEELANFLGVMMIFAFLSLFLGNRTNRLTNIIAGSIFGLASAIMLIDGVTGDSSASFNLMIGAVVVFMATVIWLAIRWPKEQV